METIATSTSPLPPPLQPKSCALCHQPSKYTCPRCHTPTCSLACSQTHKSHTGCTGVRNKAAHVSLKEYGWGSMMNDYCFLEEVGRKVGEAGREIVKGGFDMNVRGGSGGLGAGGGGRGYDRQRGGVGRGRGRGRGKERGGRGRGKREVLKMQLDMRDIEVELLASGMERRMLNQSAWDSKNQRALVTIQFKFHPTAEARSAAGVTQSFTLLTHRNDLSIPLLDLIQQHIKDRFNKKPTKAKTKGTSSGSDKFPSWIPALVLPPPEDPENFTTPTFVIAAPSDPLLIARSAALLLSSPTTTRSQSRTDTKPKPYYNLDPHEPLLQSLRGTQFVEFPLIEVWEEFSGVIVDKRTGGVRHVGEEAEPRRKRRRLDPVEGKRAINGLIGDYGSGDDGDDDEEEEEKGLVGYVGSDGEGIVEQEDATDEEAEIEQNDEDEDVEADPAALLELVQQAKQQGKWIEEDEEDSVGDGDDDDPNSIQV